MMVSDHRQALYRLDKIRENAYNAYGFIVLV